MCIFRPTVDPLKGESDFTKISSTIVVSGFETLLKKYYRELDGWQCEMV